MRRKLLLLLLAGLLTTAPAFAYVEEVHRIITTKAFDAFMAQRDVVKELGLDSLSRDNLRWEMGQGAVDEDAYFNALNHFFDPIHDAPLTIEVPTFSITFPFVPTGISCPPVPGAKTAKDWALHDPTNFDGGLDAARQLLHESVAASTESDREVAATDLFMTLGHIVHLIQDSAQPEHTRNDQHLSLPVIGMLLAGGARAPSLYENWTRDNLTGPAAGGGIYDGYPVATIQGFDRFFTSGGLGLADYSNAYFVTQDTNYGDYIGANATFHCFTYGMYMWGLTSRDQHAVATVHNIETGNDEQLSYIDTIYSRPLYDYFQHAGETDNYHTIKSVVDYETMKYNPKAATDPSQVYFSLDDDCYQSRAALLLPKAVGYSAGFLDTFFAKNALYATWTKETKDGDWKPYLINFDRDVERIDDAQIEILQGDLNGSLTPITPGGLPISQRVDGFFRVNLDSAAQPGDFIYNNDRRFIVTGTSHGMPGTVYIHDAKKSAKLEISYLYDTADGTDEAGLWLQKKSGDLITQCGGCGSLDLHTKINGAPTATDLFWNQTPNTYMKPSPFNGEIEAEIGAAPDDQWGIAVTAWPKTKNAVRGAVTIKLDGNEILRDIFVYHDIYDSSRSYSIDVAAGTATRNP